MLAKMCENKQRHTPEHSNVRRHETLKTRTKSQHLRKKLELLKTPVKCLIENHFVGVRCYVIEGSKNSNCGPIDMH